MLKKKIFMNSHKPSKWFHANIFLASHSRNLEAEKFQHFFNASRLIFFFEKCIFVNESMSETRKSENLDEFI